MNTSVPDLVFHITRISKKAILQFIVVLLFTPIFTLQAQPEINGLIRAEVGLNPRNLSDVTFGRTILQLDIPSHTRFPWITFSGQLRHDATNRNIANVAVRVREAYLPIHTEKTDIRIGQQSITWGRSTLYQPLDILTPYDLREFLTQEMTDLRLGIPAINATFYGQNNRLQAVLIPFFFPTLTPPSDSRWSIIPVSNYTAEPGEKPSFSLNNIQMALMWSVRSSLRWDLDLGAYRGFPTTPSYAKEVRLSPSGFPSEFIIRNQYSMSAALMASAEYRTGSGAVFMSETIYWFNRKSDIFPPNLAQLTADPALFTQVITSYNDREFQRESGLWVTSLGVQDNWRGWDIRSEILVEYLSVHRRDTMQDQFYTSTSLLLRRNFLSDRLSARLLTRYNFNASDYWLNPDLQYSLRDALMVTFGYHHYDGKTPPDNYGHLSFRQFDQNNFTYLKLSYWW